LTNVGYILKSDYWNNNLLYSKKAIQIGFHEDLETGVVLNKENLLITSGKDNLLQWEID